MSAYDRPTTLGGPGKLVEVDEVLLRHARPLGGERCDATLVLGVACEGQVIAGSLNDAVETNDLWTFTRDVNSASPDWLVDETDEG